jgi:hypothetical protein
MGTPDAMHASPPIDLVVMTLRNRGASIGEIARQTGLSEAEAESSIHRVTNRFGQHSEAEHAEVATAVATT